MNPAGGDPGVPRCLGGWTSPILDREMPLASYGQGGRPLLLFPPAAADVLENERGGLVRSVEPFLRAGRLQVFAVESVNGWAWLDPALPVAEQARRQSLYARYLEHEVVPAIRERAGDASARLGAAGAGFGAFHAANAVFRRPDLFDTLIGMSGFYDLAPAYLQGHSDDNCYYNNPVWYLPGLSGRYLDLLRHDTRLVLVTGQGPGEAPHESERLSEILRRKAIPHTLDLWGTDVEPEWDWWGKMLSHWVDQLY